MNVQAEVEARREFLKTEFGINLNEHMVPIIDDYEQTAEKFLMYYYPEFDKYGFINLDAILKKLGLKYVLHEKNYGYAVLDFEFKVITVDRNYSERNFYGSNRIAILHECVHWWLHRQLYMEQIISNPNQCICSGDNFFYGADVIKNQADKIARMIAMPRNVFRNYIYNNFEHLIFSRNNDAGDIECAIIELAHIFEVSVWAVKQRMIDLGFYQAIGACCVCDGKRIRPYRYSEGYNFFNKTVDISEKNLKKVLSNNEWLKQFFDCGYIKYIDGHCVYNNDLYLVNNEGDFELTDYARDHIEQACVVFYIKRVIGSFGGKAALACGIDGHVVRMEYDICQSIFDEDDRKCSQCFTNNFRDTVQALKEYRGFTLSQMSEKTGLSDRQIKNILHDTDMQITKSAVIKLCIGFSLNEQLCEDLFLLAGYHLKPMDNKFDECCTLIKKVAKHFDIYKCDKICRKQTGRGLIRNTAEAD